MKREDGILPDVMDLTTAQFYSPLSTSLTHRRHNLHQRVLCGRLFRLGLWAPKLRRGSTLRTVLMGYHKTIWLLLGSFGMLHCLNSHLSYRLLPELWGCTVGCLRSRWDSKKCYGRSVASSVSLQFLLSFSALTLIVYALFFSRPAASCSPFAACNPSPTRCCSCNNSLQKTWTM